MAQGEEPPRRLRRPPQPYVESVVDADYMSSQYAEDQPQPAAAGPALTRPRADAVPPPNSTTNRGNARSGGYGERSEDPAPGSPTNSTFGGLRHGTGGFGGREVASRPAFAVPVSQSSRPQPHLPQSNGASGFSIQPPPRNQVHNQSQAHRAPENMRRAQEARQPILARRDIVSELYGLFRNAELYDEEEPKFRLLNGWQLMGITREAYDALPIEEQVAARPHLRGRFLLSTGMSQEEVNVAVEMEMAGADPLDIEATLCSMRAYEEW
ncbi:hypothetical protein FKW77_004977 [Venturia effusa]|uniref:Uncharacterized protein n=1 Tax=Venturia effusa TaxID=50376 RepID=A0A517LHA7_9PEZI|nr:hypothetical protein FKW77_004977 [Venturia effusa]